MIKQRKIVSFENLSQELLDHIEKSFPNGLENEIKRIDAPNPFYAFTVDYQETTYLVKVKVKMDQKDIDIDDLFGSSTPSSKKNNGSFDKDDEGIEIDFDSAGISEDMADEEEF